MGNTSSNIRIYSQHKTRNVLKSNQIYIRRELASSSLYNFKQHGALQVMYTAITTYRLQHADAILLPPSSYKSPAAVGALAQKELTLNALPTWLWMAVRIEVDLVLAAAAAGYSCFMQTVCKGRGDYMGDICVCFYLRSIKSCVLAVIYV